MITPELGVVNGFTDALDHPLALARHGYRVNLSSHFKEIGSDRAINQARLLPA